MKRNRVFGVGSRGCFSASLCLLLCALHIASVATPCEAQGNGYTYRRTITIDHTKVGSTDSTSFPMLLSGTYSYLATTANSGNVNNGNGYDIIFTTDSGCSTKVAGWEVESYSPTTGAVSIWINIATLSHGSDSAIYMCYGNSSISTFQGSTTGTWDSSYGGVWHLANGSTLSPNDSTSNAHNGSLEGSPSAVTGQIGGAGSFNGSQDISLGTLNPMPSGVGTVSIWVKMNSGSIGQNNYVIAKGDDAGTVAWGLDVIPADANTMSQISLLYGSARWTATSSFAYTLTNWHHIVAVMNGNSTQQIYVDGVLRDSGSLSVSSPTASLGMYIAKTSRANPYSYSANGSIDEVRVSTATRSADWVLAEYNNQSSPSTFYSIGSPSTSTPGIGLSPTSLSFSATAGGSNPANQPVAVSNTGSGTVNWTTSVSTTSGGNWLSVTPASGTNSGTVTVSVNVSGLAAGTYNGSVTLTAAGVSNSPQVVPVTLTMAVPNVYAYSRSITIDHTKVGNSDSASFPLLLSGTYSYLATTANGGNVSNANGYDIIFTTDSGCATKVAGWEVESYSATTGAVNIWINIASLSHTTNTVIYLCYGNPVISTFQSTPTAAWDSNFQGVYHLPNGSSLTTNDSTGNHNNGTNSGASPAAGNVGGAASFDGSSNYVSVLAGGGLHTFTASLWVKTTESRTDGTFWRMPTLFGKSNAGGGSGDFGITTNNGYIGFWGGLTGGDNSYLSSTKQINNNAWHQVVVVNGGSSAALYVDGAAEGGWISTGGGLNSEAFWIGGKGGSEAAGSYHQGMIDEVRFSSNTRSADWIRAEYNNQISPSTFYTIGGPPGSNPTPVLDAISPTSAAAGSASFTLTVTGSAFVSTSQVQWNGSGRTTTYVSATQLTAAIAAADVVAGGTATVTVVSPTPGGGTSSPLTFFIGTNPTPTISALTPASMPAGSAGFNMGVSGNNFLPTTTASFRGQPRTATYVSPQQMSVAVMPADVTTTGTAMVTVSNPAPGGGTSTPASFNVGTAVPSKEYIRLGGRVVAIESGSSGSSGSGGPTSTPSLTTFSTVPSAPAANAQFIATVNGASFDPTTVQIVMTGTGCNPCTVLNSALTTKTPTQIAGPVAGITSGFYNLAVQNGSAGVLSNSLEVTVGLSLTSVSPTEAMVGQQFTADLLGTWFDPSIAQILISDSGGNPLGMVPNSALTMKTQTEIRGSVTLPSVGGYSLSVQNGNGGTTSNPQTVTAEAASASEFKLTSPNVTIPNPALWVVATVTVTSINNFNGTVFFNVSPSGFAISPLAAVSGSGTSNMTIYLNGVAAGVYPITVTGTSGSGGTAITRQVKFDVTVSDFTLTMPNWWYGTNTGGTASYSPSVSNTTTTGPVTLDTIILPAFAQTTTPPFSVNPVNPGVSTLLSTLAFTVPGWVPTYSWGFYVRGTAGPTASPVIHSLYAQLDTWNYPPQVTNITTSVNGAHVGTITGTASDTGGGAPGNIVSIQVQAVNGSGQCNWIISGNNGSATNACGSASGSASGSSANITATVSSWPGGDPAAFVWVLVTDGSGSYDSRGGDLMSLYSMQAQTKRTPAAQTTASGTISGTVIGANAKILYPAFVQYVSRDSSANAKETASGSVKVGPDGTFSITGLALGDHRLCLEAQGQGHLHSCLWGDSEVLVTLTAAKPSATNVHLQATKGNLLRIHLNDPQALLNAAESKFQFTLYIALDDAAKPSPRTGNGAPVPPAMLLPARLMNWTALGRDYEFTVPADNNATIKIFNQHFDFMDATGKILKDAIIAIPAKYDSKANNQPIVLTVVGTH